MFNNSIDRHNAYRIEKRCRSVAEGSYRYVDVEAHGSVTFRTKAAPNYRAAIAFASFRKHRFFSWIESESRENLQK
jgi:hypothetical protein